MPRTRSIPVRESEAELEQLVEFYGDTPQARRVAFLLALRQDPKRTIAEAAELAGISARRGKRWWNVYRNEGFSELLGRRPWGEPETDIAVEANSSGSESSSHAPLVADFPALANAIAQMAVVSDAHEWNRALRDSLIRFVPEVDYAVVNVRLTADEEGTSERKNRLVYRHHGESVISSARVSEREATSQVVDSNTRVYETLIEDGHRMGFPFEKYHRPLGYDFSFPRKTAAGPVVEQYVGSLLLFRNRSGPPFSGETRDLFERIRPFLGFVISDWSLRQRRSKPGSEAFRDSIVAVAEQIRMTPREHDVFMLEMLGHSYDQIARQLNISVKTVQSHVSSVYRKAGVNRLSEFFGKYFTPRLLTSDEESDE